jgi:hypothetical protein
MERSTQVEADVVEQIEGWIDVARSAGRPA